MKSGLIKNIN